MPSNLQGLNIVHPVQVTTDPHDLLSGQFHPDLAAQLDLWTNLTFECDDGPIGQHDDEKYRKSDKNGGEEEELTSHRSDSSEAAVNNGHINVVTGTNVAHDDIGVAAPLQPPHGFDLNALLAGFGIPFPSVPPPQNSNPPPGIAPSLAQLIALHSTSGAPPFVSPASIPEASTVPKPVAPLRATDDPSSPPAKRPRARKASEGATSEAAVEVSKDRKEGNGEAAGMALSAAEDKRRRNTAASARFRLKKKEREAALESKAKELEARVNELERECEGLRRENGWLKGLVVGVTGAAQAPVVNGTKRSRDEEGA